MHRSLCFGSVCGTVERTQPVGSDSFPTLQHCAPMVTERPTRVTETLVSWLR